MASNDRWMQLAVQFRWLWDPQEPCFNYPDYRAEGYQKMLNRYISEVGDDLNMVTLKLKIASLHREKASPVVKSVCITCMNRMKEIAELVAEFPCLWNPKDLNYLDIDVTEHCKRLVLLKYNNHTGVDIAMPQLRIKLAKFNQIWAQCPATPGVPCGPKAKTPHPQDVMLFDLMPRYPCLWDSEDLNFRDLTVKKKCREQLLAEYNYQTGMHITIKDLKRKLRGINTYLSKYGSKRSVPVGSGASVPPASAVPTAARQPVSSLPTVSGLPAASAQPTVSGLPVFSAQPTASAVIVSTALPVASGLSTVSAQPNVIGLPAASAQSTVCGLPTTSGQAVSGPSTISVLPNDLQEQATPSPVKISSAASYFTKTRRKTNKMAELMTDFPCLWDSKDLDFRSHIRRAEALDQLLLKYNKRSNVQITMVDLKRKVKMANQFMIRHGVKSVGDNFRLSRMHDMLKEFPCLWDRTDLNYRDIIMKAECREQLLVKYNSQARLKITMEELKRKIKDVIKFCRNQTIESEVEFKSQSSNMAKLAEEFPCLWDPWDCNFYDYTIKARCREQLLVKYNQQSSIIITMEQLKRKLKSMNNTLARQYAKAGHGPRSARARLARLLPEDPEASSDSNEPLVQCKTETPPNPCCQCCGQTPASISIAGKPYVADDKTTLALNHLIVVLDFSPDNPNKICDKCDTKLKEIFDFVTLVKDAQENLKSAYDLADDVKMETISVDDSDDEDIDDNQTKKNDVMDSLTVTNTEFVKNAAGIVHANDATQVKEPEKRIVSIDLNLCPTQIVDDNSKSLDESYQCEIDSLTANTEDLVKKMLLRQVDPTTHAKAFHNIVFEDTGSAIHIKIENIDNDIENNKINIDEGKLEKKVETEVKIAKWMEDIMKSRKEANETETLVERAGQRFDNEMAGVSEVIDVEMAGGSEMKVSETVGDSEMKVTEIAGTSEVIDNEMEGESEVIERKVETEVNIVKWMEDRMKASEMASKMETLVDRAAERLANEMAGVSEVNNTACESGKKVSETAGGSEMKDDKMAVGSEMTVSKTADASEMASGSEIKVSKPNIPSETVGALATWLTNYKY